MVRILVRAFDFFYVMLVCIDTGRLRSKRTNSAMCAGITCIKNALTFVGIDAPRGLNIRQISRLEFYVLPDIALLQAFCSNNAPNYVTSRCKKLQNFKEGLSFSSVLTPVDPNDKRSFWSNGLR